MPSTERTTLSRIQQEIQDVMKRERELKKLNNLNDNNNNSDEDDVDGSVEQKPTLVRIQEEIENVMARERELKKSQNNGFPNNNNNNINQFDNNEDSAGEDLNGDHTDRSSNHSLTSDSASKSDEIESSLNHNQRQHQSLENGHSNTGSNTRQEGSISVRAPLLRAKSTPTLADAVALATKPHFRRLISTNPNKGVMHRFIKSRGKLQNLTSNIIAQNKQSNLPKTPFINGPTPNGFSQNIDSYELAPPKVIQGQRLRKNFIPTEKKIQQDIEATFKRETELKNIRQSQGNLALLDDADLDAPLENYGLRASKSMAQLYSSDDTLDEPTPVDSAPSSLKAAKSLAQLCDAKDEEVTSPQALITHFQQMIIKNQESNRA